MQISIGSALVEGIIGRSTKNDCSELVLKVVLLSSDIRCALRLPLDKDWSPDRVRILLGQKIDVLEVVVNQEHLYHVLPFANQSGKSRLMSLRHKKSIEDGYKWLDRLPMVETERNAQSPHPLVSYLERILLLDGPASAYPPTNLLGDSYKEKKISKKHAPPTDEELRQLAEYLEAHLTEDDVEDDPF